MRRRAVATRLCPSVKGGRTPGSPWWAGPDQELDWLCCSFVDRRYEESDIPIFDGHEYPKWKAMMKKRLMAMNSELWTVTEIGLTDLCKMAEADDVYEGHRTCHDPWFEDFKESLKSMTFEPESSSSSSCLMADDQLNSLLSDHEKLRMSYEDLQKERDSLLAQQISATQEEFVPPCLKCIERESANSSPECSNASNVTNSSPASAITNSSSEDIASITNDAGLKELYMTGMYKSLKGHQTLCDVLKNQILNRNPRKEGIAFERKLNADGTYWKPEQYPKTSWVAAKGPPVGPSNLSSYTCESSHSSDESFDSNYKLFKNQNGEVFARYVGTNCRNGSPMKKIWVPKRCLESLRVNVLMTPPVKNRNPRSNSSYGPNSSYGSKSSYGPNSSRGSNSSKGSKSSYEHHRANNSVSQGRAKGYEYEHYSSNHYVHKSSKNFSAYSYAYPNPSYVKRNGLASMPPFSYGAHRVMNSLPPLQMWLKNMADGKKPQKGGKKPEVMTAFEIPEDIYAVYCTPDEAKFGKENKNQHKIDEEIKVDAIPSTLVVSSPMPQFTAEEAGVEEIDDEDVDIGSTTPVMNDDFWESQHPNSPLFTPLQQIPHSPAPTVQLGSEETHPTSFVREDIPATSAEETVAADNVTVPEEEPEIPQPEEPELMIPEFYATLHITGDSEDVNSWVLD
ncbi:uncharacterized protein LOC125546749 [Triticum urartu]|uniref:uncharacterized protein LOC125546749 n=1 Tax=Triticum urartu TaxID=4572 RepID=UPI002043E283|nr:uncharacterized protein LOC125546749 [Triticum urartu]